MINRLVLNLRTFNTLDQETKGSTRNSHSAHAFPQNRILGNIGAPLDSDQWDAESFNVGDIDLDNPDLHGSDLGWNINEVRGLPTDTMVPVVRVLCII